MKNIRKKIMFSILGLGLIALICAVFTIFFDQAVLVRKGTFYLADVNEKVAALTFDDGPSPLWTPRILIALKQAGVKATFFMLGEHVEKYPEVARLVAAEGHEIGNHTYTHHTLFYFTDEELKDEVKRTEKIIKDVTGQTTKYFRPPKAWMNKNEKEMVKQLGYTTVLWTLNSKDWVNFDDKYIRSYIVKNIRPGEIILFHDSGGVFGVEGGSRKETVLTIPRMVEQLKEKGYRFVTISELLKLEKKNGN